MNETVMITSNEVDQLLKEIERLKDMKAFEEFIKE